MKKNLALLAILVFPMILLGQSRKSELWESFNYFHERNNMKTALLYLDSLIAIDSANQTFHLLSGAIHHNNQKYKQAITSFSIALKINPNIIDAYARRGSSFYELQKYNEAISDFNKAIGKYSWQDSIIYKYRGASYNNLGYYELALMDYDSALNYSPMDEELLTFKSIALYKIGKYDSSLEYVNNALNINKNYHKALKQKAILLSLKQDLQEALKYALRYNNINGHDSENLLNIANLYVQMKDPENALNYLTHVKPPVSNSIEFYINRGVANFYLANNINAINDFENAIALNPSNSQIHALMADCYFEINDIKNGCKYLREALSLGLSEVDQMIKENCK